MTGKAQRTIRIKWVRSAIALPYRQKDMVRSLGLLRLNQVVERPDTPQIRGLVARIPHLVKIVEPAAEPFQFSIPEYTLLPPEARPAKAVRGADRAEAEIEPAEGAAGAVAEQEAPKVPAEEVKAQKEKKEKAAAPAKVTKAKKAAKPAAADKKKAAKGEEKKKTKAAAKSGKSTKSSKK